MINRILPIFLCSVCVYASSWPTWRGLKQNSKSDETISLTSKLDAPAWEAQVGQGYSSVSVYEDFLITAGNTEEKDTIYCLSAKTGKEIWKYSYPCKGKSRFSGTRATPVTDGSSVFMVSRDGHLNCLNLKDGKSVWQKNLLKDYGIENIYFGLSASIVFDNDNIYLNAGEKGMSFAKKDGSLVWKHQRRKGGYATPTIFNYAGKDYLAVFGDVKLFIIEKNSGKEVTSYEWKGNRNSNSADPIVSEDGSEILITSTGNKSGSSLLKFDGKSLTKVWSNDKFKSQFSTPVLHEGTLYGCNGRTGKGTFVAVDYKTGQIKWEEKQRFGSPILAKNALIYLNERGEVLFVKPNSQKMELVKKQRVLSKGKCWTIPVLANGLLYCRNDKGALVALKVN